MLPFPAHLLALDTRQWIRLPPHLPPPLFFCSPYSDGSKELIVVTLLVAADGSFKLPQVDSRASLKQALAMMGAVRADDLLAVEVLWTPEEEVGATSAAPASAVAAAAPADAALAAARVPVFALAAPTPAPADPHLAWLASLPATA